MHVSACMCESDYMPDTLRTFLDASELNHNGPLLLGAVKTTGGRGGEAWGGRKGRERWGKAAVGGQSVWRREDCLPDAGNKWRQKSFVEYAIHSPLQSKHFPRILFQQGFFFATTKRLMHANYIDCHHY